MYTYKGYTSKGHKAIFYGDTLLCTLRYLNILCDYGCTEIKIYICLYESYVCYIYLQTFMYLRSRHIAKITFIQTNINIFCD